MCGWQIDIQLNFNFTYNLIFDFRQFMEISEFSKNFLAKKKTNNFNALNN
jgi:hypothetical protein